MACNVLTWDRQNMWLRDDQTLRLRPMGLINQMAFLSWGFCGRAAGLITELSLLYKLLEVVVLYCWGLSGEVLHTVVISWDSWMWRSLCMCVCLLSESTLKAWLPLYSVSTTLLSKRHRKGGHLWKHIGSQEPPLWCSGSSGPRAGAGRVVPISKWNSTSEKPGLQPAQVQFR